MQHWCSSSDGYQQFSTIFIKVKVLLDEPYSSATVSHVCIYIISVLLREACEPTYRGPFINPSKHSTQLR